MKMGWDAIATGNKLNEAKVDFKSSAENVIQQVGEVDGMLSFGGLHLHESARCLELSTGKSVYTEKWTVEEVKNLAENSNWQIESNYSNCARLSAMFFLHICAKYDLEIKFSW